jgi:hypothetical protein
MRASWAGCFLPSPPPYPPGYSGRREYLRLTKPPATHNDAEWPSQRNRRPRPTRQRQSLPGLGRSGNLNSILKTDFPGNADERHRPGTVLHLAHSRQDLLNLLLGLPDGLSMTRNGNNGVSTGRIAMWVSISD